MISTSKQVLQCGQATANRGVCRPHLTHLKSLVANSPAPDHSVSVDKYNEG